MKFLKEICRQPQLIDANFRKFKKSKHKIFSEEFIPSRCTKYNYDCEYWSISLFISLRETSCLLFEKHEITDHGISPDVSNLRDNTYCVVYLDFNGKVKETGNVSLRSEAERAIRSLYFA